MKFAAVRRRRQAGFVQQTIVTPEISPQPRRCFSPKEPQLAEIEDQEQKRFRVENPLKTAFSASWPPGTARRPQATSPKSSRTSLNTQRKQLSNTARSTNRSPRREVTPSAYASLAPWQENTLREEWRSRNALLLAVTIFPYHRLRLISNTTARPQRRPSCRIRSPSNPPPPRIADASSRPRPPPKSSPTLNANHSRSQAPRRNGIQQRKSSHANHAKAGKHRRSRRANSNLSIAIREI